MLSGPAISNPSSVLMPQPDVPGMATAAANQSGR
jgi:hypothetical protein